MLAASQKRAVPHPPPWVFLRNTETAKGRLWSMKKGFEASCFGVSQVCCRMIFPDRFILANHAFRPRSDMKSMISRTDSERVTLDSAWGICDVLSSLFHLCSVGAG